MKLENSLLFDHDPSDPRIGPGEQEEQADDCTGAEVQELDAEGEGKENASREDVDGPFYPHSSSLSPNARNILQFIHVRF